MFKVLIADDDPNVGSFLKRLVEKKFDSDVTTVLNGLEALSKIKDDKPDVMFLDITMPVMSGIETLEVIRNDSKMKNLPVIILSAVSQKETINKIMSLGVDDYILKPLSYQTTSARLNNIFQKVKGLKNIDISANLETHKKEEQIHEKRKILFVSNDYAFIQKVSEILSKNFIVFKSQSGGEGIDIFLNKTPDIVCLGENLQGMNERLLAKKIKSTDQNIQIIAIKESTESISEENNFFNNTLKKNNTIEDFIKELMKIVN